MSRLVAVVATVALAVLASCGRDPTTDQSIPLRTVRDIRLPGTTSRFDYQDVDPGRRRLFVAHLGASRVEVIDLDSLRVVTSITGLADVHGVRAAAAIGRLYVSATGTDQAVTFDEDTLGQLRRSPTGRYPDGIAVDLTRRRVFVSNERGGTETVLDADTGGLIGTVELGGEAGNVAIDPSTDRVLVAVQTADEVVTIDPTSLGVVRRTHLDGCVHPHGLYVDTNDRLGFVACDANNELLVFDLDTTRTTASFRTGDTPDVMDLDPGLGRLYVAAESGTVSVFSINSRAVRLMGRAHLAAGAHSIAVDPATHQVFVPLPSVGGHPVVRVMAAT